MGRFIPAPKGSSSPSSGSLGRPATPSGSPGGAAYHAGSSMSTGLAQVRSGMAAQARTIQSAGAGSGAAITALTQGGIQTPASRRIMQTGLNSARTASAAAASTAARAAKGDPAAIAALQAAGLPVPPVVAPGFVPSVPGTAYPDSGGGSGGGGDSSGGGGGDSSGGQGDGGGGGDEPMPSDDQLQAMYAAQQQGQGAPSAADSDDGGGEQAQGGYYTSDDEDDQDAAQADADAETLAPAERHHHHRKHHHHQGRHTAQADADTTPDDSGESDDDESGESEDSELDSGDMAGDPDRPLSQVSCYVQAGKLHCMGVIQTQYGPVPIATSIRVNPATPEGPAQFGEESEMAATVGRNSLMNAADLENLRQQTEGLVMRSRQGDQNATATIKEVRDSASMGSPRARIAHGLIAEYIRFHPVEDDGVAFEVDPIDSTQLRTAVKLANGPTLTGDRVNDLISTFAGNSHRKRNIIAHGVHKASFGQEGDLEAVKAQLDRVEKALIDLGKVVGKALGIQRIRIPGTPISSYSPEAGWELGEGENH